MALLEVRGVSKWYRSGKLSFPALRAVDLAVEQGEFIALAGPSGSGKTTLLNLIGCLDVPTEGEIVFDQVAVASLKPQQLVELRREKIGFIFQSFNLIPVLTAFENVEFPLLLRGLPARRRRELVAQALCEVGLWELAGRRAAELSGGEQQRVAIARALVGRPKLVLADEPTASLDSRTGESILELMWDLNRQHGLSFIFSTHDPRIMRYATRLIRLQDGRVVEDERRGAGGKAPRRLLGERALEEKTGHFLV
ncbi:MAG: ABC transporter ATP-binding protein [Bacillota bacterium]|nr:ABC transporter ATP-binding protein [Bacillota bacterium]